MKIIEEIEGFFSEKVSAFKTLTSMMKMEAKLAGLSVFPLLINLCALFIILITVWFSLMALSGYLILPFVGTPVLAVLSIFILNMILFFGLLKYLTYNLRNMSFEKTREYFSRTENDDYEQIEKTTNSQHSVDAETTVLPTNESGRA